jgi:Ni/Co efflux regulator RcnB
VKRLISAAIALTLLGGTAALAQRDYPNYQNQNSDQRQNNDGRFNSGINESHNDRPRWSRGDRLPEQYRQDRYAVTDWQQHNLRTPPRGYRWVRNDNDQYVLAGVTSGIIVEIVSQNQYRNDYRWSRGDRLSGGYMENRYVVSDWRANHLRRPARGYHWVHVNNQYMLVSVGNGLIAEIVVDGR